MIARYLTLLKCYYFSFDNGIAATLNFQRNIGAFMETFTGSVICIKWLSICMCAKDNDWGEDEVKTVHINPDLVAECVVQGFGRRRRLEGQASSPSLNYCITEWKFCSPWGLLSVYQTGSGIAKQKVRDDRRQLDKGVQEILELLQILWRKASKTNRASRANTASELLCVLNCPHNDINQDG